MSITVLIPNAALEAVATSLDNWIKWLRPGTLSAKIGALKGAVLPMAQGVYYDREALLDEHAVWDQTPASEGGDPIFTRRVKQDKSDNGTVLREAIVFKDPRKYNSAMRAFLLKEQPVVLPYLVEEKWFTDQAMQLVKDQMGLVPPDFAPLNYIRELTKKLANGDQPQS